MSMHSTYENIQDRIYCANTQDTQFPSPEELRKLISGICLYVRQRQQRSIPHNFRSVISDLAKPRASLLTSCWWNLDVKSVKSGKLLPDVIVLLIFQINAHLSGWHSISFVVESEIRINDVFHEPMTEQPKVPIAEMRKIMDFPDPVPRPPSSRQPNTMVYTDGDGKEREIWLPKGLMHRAWGLLQEKKRDKLAGFEDWSDCTYSV